MKKYRIIIYGILITILIDYLSSFNDKFLNIKIDFFPNSFFKHTIILILSVIAIIILRKYVNFRIGKPKMKTLFKPIGLGLLVSFLSSLIMGIILISSNQAVATPVSNLTIIQIIFFVFIYSSIVEEVLFRGFLLNILSPIKNNGILIFQKKISYSVLISALMFGLYHIIPINSNHSTIYIIGMLIAPSILGIVAGYYQEKYNNHFYSILIHMSGNLIGIIGMILMS